MKRRLIYIGVSLFVLSLYFGIVQFFGSNRFVPGIIADGMVVAFLYALSKSIADFHSVKLSIFIIVFLLGIEAFQYWKLIQELGFEKVHRTNQIFHSLFLDLSAYSIGLFVVVSIDTRIVRKLSTKQT